MTKDVVTLTYQPDCAYLELARSFINAPVVNSSNEKTEGGRFSENTGFALISLTYVFSYTAMVAFVNGQLGRYWTMDPSPLKSAFPKAKNLHSLLKQDLSELKEAIKELCRQTGVPQLCETDTVLWNNLLQVSKRVRDYLVHPYPDSDVFNTIVKESGEKREWQFPSKVAESVIGYFYTHTSTTKPDWLSANREFRFTSISALKVRSATKSSSQATLKGFTSGPFPQA